MLFIKTSWNDVSNKLNCLDFSTENKIMQNIFMEGFVFGQILLLEN